MAVLLTAGLLWIVANFVKTPFLLIPLGPPLLRGSLAFIGGLAALWLLCSLFVPQTVLLEGAAVALVVEAALVVLHVRGARRNPTQVLEAMRRLGRMRH